jgi:hypothetical protein
MSAFIPDQLDEMSRKELVKAAKIMHEHNVKLMALITVAKERVKELEGFYATYEREFKAVTKWAISMQNDICEGKYYNNTPEGMIYSENAWVDCRWQDVTDPIFTTHEEALNKFALEQKIEGMQRVLDCRELNLSQGEVDTIKLMQEQLRKEQEK